MQPYVIETWGAWVETWQFDRFRQKYQPGWLRVLQLDGQDVGMMQVQDRTEELFLANLKILPEFQNRGVGSRVIRQLVEEAARQGKLVALRVLKVNVRARALYQRLGFGITGENDTHYILSNEKSVRMVG